MFVEHNDPVYEGMIIGIHSRDNDLVVNPIKGKQLTNVRASGTDEAVRLVPPIQMSLEYAVEFIEDDELVEITPKSIRLRKRYLKEHERKASREGGALRSAAGRRKRPRTVGLLCQCFFLAWRYFCAWQHKRMEERELVQ
jgi:hypothetical protein